MFKPNRKSFCTMAATTVAISALAGCSVGTSSGAAGSVTARVNVVNRMTTALTEKLHPLMGHPPAAPGVLQSINGVYGDGCTDRSGAWSVGLTDSATLDNAPLSVVTNDNGCTLILTSIEGQSQYFATPSIPLGAQYQTPASAFTVNADGTGAVVFYANGMVSDPTFSSDFVLDILYSNQPSLADATAGASYATSSATATSGTVAAPDNALDLTGLAIQVDANNNVQAVGGVANLTPSSTEGQTYVVDVNNSFGSSPSFAQLDAIYSAAQTPGTLSDTTIPASAFDLAGELGGAPATLPAQRNLIIANTDASGVRSYQVFMITFEGP